MLIGPPVSETQLLKKMTFKIQGQGHGWGQSSKSQRESNILSTHIPFIPYQSALPFLRYSIFKIWPWKSKVKVIAQGHKVGITPYRLISPSFHVDWPSYSWDTAISKFDVENSRSRSWVRSKLKVTRWVQHSVESHPFCSMSIGHPIPELRLFQNLTSKIKDQGQMTMMLHNYSSRQFHRTSNGINPSSVFRDTGSASLAQVLPDLICFWPMGKAIWGKWANNYGIAQLHV